MRHLFRTVAAGAMLVLTGFASAQAPAELAPSGGIMPATPRPAAVSASPSVTSVQAQLEAQQRDISALTKTVAQLTEQLQRASAATGESTPGIAAQQVGASPSLRELVGPPMPLAIGSDELQQTQQALADLNAQREAASQAPASDPLNKELELQRKQIDLLNKMVKLLASELAKQGPAVAKMQTQVASLDARSKQAAQRDQELANGVDNLNEHVDFLQRYGVQLPAPLKELFDPSYNNETPLSIYGALVERYTQFHPERWGTFETPTFSGFFLLTLNQWIFFEGNTDFSEGSIGVPWAQLDFLLGDHLTAVVGRYLVPIGFYNERLSFEWGDKLPDDPLMFHQVSPLTSTDGVQLRGSTYLFCSPVKMEYALWFGNGMELTAAPGSLADLADLDVLAGSDNTHAKAVGGRVGLWVPKWGINGGVSGYFDYNYALGPPTVLSLAQVSVDASYHKGNWDARFEAAYMKQQATPIIGHDIQRSGLYFQLAYRPYNVSNFFLQKLEFAARYSLERFTGIDPAQLDFTTFADNVSVPVDRNQYAFSINYYFYAAGILKFGYEINQELHGINLDDNVFYSQLVLGF